MIKILNIGLNITLLFSLCGENKLKDLGFCLRPPGTVLACFLYQKPQATVMFCMYMIALDHIFPLVPHMIAYEVSLLRYETKPVLQAAYLPIKLCMYVIEMS